MSCQCLPPSDIPSFIAQIPNLLNKHQHNYPTTKQVEQLAKQVIKNNFDPIQSAQFVKEVCNWATPTGNRVRGKVFSYYNNNNYSKIGRALKMGYESVQKGCVGTGVEYIRELRGLGQSFASKILRFLCPEDTVILDKIIREQCDYNPTVSEYNKFLDFCHNLLDQSKKSHLLPSNFKNKLRVCDIEAALFIYIKP